jgi:potassium efflux system protein
MQTPCPNVRWFLALLAAALVGFAATGAAAAAPAAAPDLTVERLQSRQAAAAAREDIDAETRSRIDSIYKRAIAETERAAKLQRNAEAMRDALDSMPRETAALQKELDEAERSGTPEATVPAIESLSSQDIDRLVGAAQLARDDAQQRLDALSRAETELADRPLAARRERDAAREELDRLRADSGGPKKGPLTALAEANQALVSARITALQAELDHLDRESAIQPGQLRLTQLKRDLARFELAHRQATLQTWLDAAERRRQEDAAAAQAEAARAQQSLADKPPAVRELASRNAALSADLAQVTAEVDRAVRELGQLRSATGDLEKERKRVEADLHGRRLGAESAQTLVGGLERLPTAERFVRSQKQRDAIYEAAADASLRIDRELNEIGNLPAAVQAILDALPPQLDAQERGRLEAEIRELLANQRVLLGRTNERYKTLAQTLRETDAAEDEFNARLADTRTEMTRALFWVPLNPIGSGTFAALRAALNWTFSPANWREAGAALVGVMARMPVGTGAVLLVVAGLYGWRGRWRRKLAALAPAAVSVEQYRIAHTLQALLLTLLLASPGALLLRSAGDFLAAAPGASPFTLAVADALGFVSATYLALYGFSWLFDPHGVAVKHFRWPAEAMSRLQQAIRRFMLIYLPVAFVAVMNVSQHAGFRSTESLGRMAFIAAMLLLAAFLWRTFRRTGPVMAELLPQVSRHWAARLYPLWFGALVASPLALALLSAVGYFFAATAVYSLLKRTLLVVLSAVVVYGLVALWVLIQRARLARRQAAEAAQSELADVGEEGAAVSRLSALDIAAIGDRSRRLLNLVATGVLVGGLWLIWQDALVFLNVIGELNLWSSSETVDGQITSHSVTLGSLFLALLVLGITVAVSRNVGFVMDMVLLQRFELQKDATYAIKTVSRYVILGVGLIAVSNILHIDWSKLQWLVAALGLGLGFGLQEVVANFVSGLIVLGERPIRIGDVVTVGDISGTVTRIRARATVVTDFDNKETMIPNKAFITERVVNWTLYSQVTRLLITVGVAYGSDVEKARSVMMEAVKSVPEVLEEPAPSVFFVRFGESSLDFEIRAHVDGIDKRLRTQHEINVAVERALSAAGIEIPFPQRHLHLKLPESLSRLVPPAS